MDPENGLKGDDMPHACSRKGANWLTHTQEFKILQTLKCLTIIAS